MGYQKVEGLWVSIDQVEYIHSEQAPPHRPHQFVYYITIHNESVQVITLKSRRWVITNHEGHRLMIEGDGIMGQFPTLKPGDTFPYNSYHLLDTSASAEGAYFGMDEDGEKIQVKIPIFEMKVPA